MIRDGRTLDGLPVPYRLHQEDFAQALGIPSVRKYEKKADHYLYKMFSLLARVSDSPLEDSILLWKEVIFDWLIGNTDNHIKNFSLLYNRGMSAVRLSPAYDLVSTAIYESSTRKMSFSINEKFLLDNIKRSDFEAEAEKDGLGVKAAMEQFDLLQKQFPSAMLQAARQMTKEGFADAEKIANRILSRK